MASLRARQPLHSRPWGKREKSLLALKELVGLVQDAGPGQAGQGQGPLSELPLRGLKPAYG